MKRKLLFLILVIVVAFIIYQFLFRPNSRASSSVPLTAVVTKGDLDITVNATGTLEPEEVVDVGAQVAGKITSFGNDSQGKIIDYGSEVEEGTVLALIDDVLYQADLLQAEALLKRANATAEQAQAKYFQADRDWTRAQKLGSSEVLAKSSFDAAQSAYLLAKADISAASAEIAQAEATLNKAKRNIDNCTIRSPVHGVIIDRRVNIGQTVVASLNAPSLFLIAKDLSQMEVWVSVNEADIANIIPDQKAIFTVDAIPGAEFSGIVKKIRLNATMTQNVVTYVVEVRTENKGKKLLPYLTANVRFMVRRLDDVLLVPVSALRWNPSEELEQIWNATAQVNSKRAESKLQKELSGKSLQNQRDQTQEGKVWILEGDIGKTVPVVVLGSDNLTVAISGEGIKEGANVIVGDEKQRSRVSNSQTLASPFTPSVGRGRH